MYIAEILPRKKQISVDSLSELIYLDHGLNKDEVSEVLAVMGTKQLCSIYSYYYVSDPIKAFRYSEPYVTPQGVTPTLREIEYGEQEFEKFRTFNISANGSNAVELEMFADFLTKLFDQKTDIVPIINWLVLNEKISINGDKVEFYS